MDIPGYAVFNHQCEKYSEKWKNMDKHSGGLLTDCKEKKRKGKKRKNFLGYAFNIDIGTLLCGKSNKNKYQLATFTLP